MNRENIFDLWSDTMKFMILTELYVNLWTQGYTTYHVNNHYHLARKLYILNLYCLAKLRKVHINNLLLGIRKLKVQVEKCFQILWLRPFRSIAFMSNRKNKCICLWEILARLTSFIFAKRVYTFCESLIVADSDNDILQNNTVRYIRSIFGRPDTICIYQGMWYIAFLIWLNIIISKMVRWDDTNLLS